MRRKKHNRPSQYQRKPTPFKQIGRGDALSKALKLEHLLHTLEGPDGLLHDITLPFLQRLTEVIDALPGNFTLVALYIEAATEAYTYAEANGNMNASWAIMSDCADLLKHLWAVFIEHNKPSLQNDKSPEVEHIALENAMYSELVLTETTMRRHLSWPGINTTSQPQTNRRLSRRDEQP